jgi:hypothetical protein
VKALVALAKLHPELPAVAVAEVEHEVDPDGWEEPVTWGDLTPTRSRWSRSARRPSSRPTSTSAGRSIRLERFTLTEKAAKDLEKLAKLAYTISQVQFGLEEHQRARRSARCTAR